MGVYACALNGFFFEKKKSIHYRLYLQSSVFEGGRKRRHKMMRIADRKSRGGRLDSKQNSS